MVPDEKRAQDPEQLTRSFQILDLVSRALHQIAQGSDPTAITPTVTQLHQRITACEQTLDKLPGGAMTRAEQLAEITRLRESLDRKRELVKRYSSHDLVARVAMQRAIPEDGNAAEAEAEVDGEGDAGGDGGDAADIDIDFPEVGGDTLGVVREEGDDVIMGLGI